MTSRRRQGRPVGVPEEEIDPVRFDENGVVVIITEFEYRVILTLVNGEKWEGKWTKAGNDAETPERTRQHVYDEVMERIAKAREAISLVVREGLNERYRVFYRHVIAYADIEVQEIYS
jgi:hypothetical protein